MRIRDIEEKKRGKSAKERLIEILKQADNNFILTSQGLGKYDRCLGTLSVNISSVLCNVNKMLVKEGHAVKYLT